MKKKKKEEKEEKKLNNFFGSFFEFNWNFCEKKPLDDRKKYQR